MRWFRDHIFGRRQEPQTDGPPAEDQSEEQTEGSPEDDDTRPVRLVLLVRDAAGPASYQLHTFEDAPEAAAFVQFWFPTSVEHGVIAFWASIAEPAPAEDGRPQGEVVVLVRDEIHPKTVYPFSFSNMNVARTWVERESERGLDLSLVLAYWAVAVTITRDRLGRAFFTPAEPPALENEPPPTVFTPHAPRRAPKRAQRPRVFDTEDEPAPPNPPVRGPVFAQQAWLEELAKAVEEEAAPVDGAVAPEVEAPSEETASAEDVVAPPEAPARGPIFAEEAWLKRLLKAMEEVVPAEEAEALEEEVLPEGAAPEEAALEDEPPSEETRPADEGEALEEEPLPEETAPEETEGLEVESLPEEAVADEPVAVEEEPLPEEVEPDEGPEAPATDAALEPVIEAADEPEEAVEATEEAALAFQDSGEEPEDGAPPALFFKKAGRKNGRDAAKGGNPTHGRWETRRGPFQGFGSPPGRF